MDAALRFAAEIDRLKTVYRRTYTPDGRREDVAGHSWHMAAMIMLLSDRMDEPVDVCRALKMALVHDLAEIEAGDVYAFEDVDPEAKRASEAFALEGLIKNLPATLADEIRSLWQEYEDRTSPEARLVKAMDCLQPVLTHLNSEGRSWREHGVRRAQVSDRVRQIRGASESLWRAAEAMLDDAQAKGWLL